MSAAPASADATGIHQLQLGVESFRAITLGLQHALVVSHGLGAAVGDQLVLREWRAAVPAGKGHYTGEWICRRVMHETLGAPGTGIDEGYSVLSLNNALENEWASTLLKRQLALAERQGCAPERFWTIQEQRERHRRAAVLKARQAR